MTLFGKLADREDGGRGSPRNHLSRVWMPVSFTEQRGRGGEEVKEKRPFILQNRRGCVDFFFSAAILRGQGQNVSL